MDIDKLIPAAQCLPNNLGFSSLMDIDKLIHEEREEAAGTEVGL